MIDRLLLVVMLYPMEWLTTRLVALGTALVITLALVGLAGLASRYVSERTTPPPRPPQEYIINLQTSPTGSVSQPDCSGSGAHPASCSRNAAGPPNPR
jgi:hypothetical protein